jgi:chemotaxis protein CheZ
MTLTQSIARQNAPEIVMARHSGKSYFTASSDAIINADSDQSRAGSAEILRAIADLRADLLGREAEAVVVSNSGVEPGDEPGVETTSAIDNEDILRNLTELAQAIIETKREISSIRDPKSNSSDDVRAATLELDAVISATEAATNDIMGAAETIDDLAGRRRSQLASDADKAIAEEINERVIEIFEACNFQDITGQRITKVVKTLTFIEERVSAMMLLRGAVPVESNSIPDGAPDEDGHLLNGPALEGDGASQDDIDALFD